jgi:hypothetical protein
MSSPTSANPFVLVSNSKNCADLIKEILAAMIYLRGIKEILRFESNRFGSAQILKGLLKNADAQAF